MQKQQFLFLTNVNNTYSALLKYSNLFPMEIDFIVHSTEKEAEHIADLRNVKIINNHLSESTTIIFYLTGNLSIYIINEYFKKFSFNKHKVVYVFSALNLFYSQNNFQFNITRQMIDIIAAKSDNCLFLSVLMPENIYKNHFIKWDEKYFTTDYKFENLVISNDKLIEEIVKLSESENAGKFFYLISKEYNLMKKLLAKVRINRLEKLFANIFPQKKSHTTFYEEFNALNRFANQMPNFKNVSVISPDSPNHTNTNQYGNRFLIEVQQINK